MLTFIKTISFHTESLGAFHRRNTEIDMITNVESEITMLAVIVALLTLLSGLEILTYDVAHFFGF